MTLYISKQSFKRKKLHIWSPKCGQEISENSYLGTRILEKDFEKQLAWQNLDEQTFDISVKICHRLRAT